MLVALPAMAVSLVVGLIVSIFQTVTSINHSLAMCAHHFGGAGHRYLDGIYPRYRDRLQAQC